MVTPEYLQTLYAYHSWATKRILTTADGLTDAALDQAPIQALATLRETCVHAFSAEWIWRNRIEGNSPTHMLVATDFPNLMLIRERWQHETAALQEIIHQCSAYDLERTIHYTSTEGKPYSSSLWQILVHVANHGMQHRTELAAMLTILGRSPGDLDLIRYFRSQQA